MYRRVLVCVTVAAAFLTLSPSPSSGASKEIMELQRDVAALQDAVRALQRSQDEKLATLQTLVQQSLTAANEANRSVAIIQNGFQQSLRDQETKVVTPVVGLSTRMDQVSTDMRTLSQAVADVTGLISKMQSQLTDLKNAVTVLQTPAAAPPGSTTSMGAPGGAPGGAGEAPPISSESLYNNANRDRMGGKFDLAVQEYADYLKWYGNTDLAPNAQYYIAWIHASMGDYENAVHEYDIVLEKYPDNNKTADAMYGKGQALVKIGRRTDGSREYQELIKRFPKNDLSNKACDQLKGMGLSCGVRSSAPVTKGTAKRKQ